MRIRSSCLYGSIVQHVGLHIGTPGFERTVHSGINLVVVKVQNERIFFEEIEVY